MISRAEFACFALHFTLDFGHGLTHCAARLIGGPADLAAALGHFSLRLHHFAPYLHARAGCLASDLGAFPSDFRALASRFGADAGSVAAVPPIGRGEYRGKNEQSDESEFHKAVPFIGNTPENVFGYEDVPGFLR
jgi:hypothetical protein